MDFFGDPGSENRSTVVTNDFLQRVRDVYSCTVLKSKRKSSLRKNASETLGVLVCLCSLVRRWKIRWYPIRVSAEPVFDDDLTQTAVIGRGAILGLSEKFWPALFPCRRRRRSSCRLHTHSYTTVCVCNIHILYVHKYYNLLSCKIFVLFFIVP